MQEFKAKLVERIKRTGTVESFRFVSAEKINFLPGQFLQLIFDPVNRFNRELNKFLSFSSSPRKEYLEVTKRLSESKFSQKLRGLKIDDEVLLKAPMGECVFKEQDRKIAFLIGGIGITPVISIIGYIVDQKLNTDVLLVYSSRTEEDIAFKKELDYWRSLNVNLKIIYTVTDSLPKDKSCYFSPINRDLLVSKIADLKERILFIFGPPRMVEAMRNLALELGCQKEKIKTEQFVGY